MKRIETQSGPPGSGGTSRFYRGWRIVAISALFHALFSGLYHTGLSVYFLPLQRTFEVSRTQMSLAYSLRSLEGGIEGPIAGHLVDRVGPRPIVIAGVVIGGAGFLLLALTQSYMAFLLVFLGVLSVGFNAPFHGLMATINFWFRRRLGTAMSLATTGSAIGGFLITPLVAWIVLNESWRTAALLSGGLILLAGLPLAMLVRMPRGDEAAPEDAMGLVRTDRHGRTLPSDSGVEFTVRQAVRTRTFWFLAVAIGIRLMAQSALTVHFVPMLVSRGVGEGTAAVLVSVHAVTRLPAVVLGGLVADRWSRSKTSAVAMLLGVSASVFITPGPGGIATGVIFAMLFACAEATNTVTWALIGQYFGRKNFATLRGIVTTLQSALSFLGPIAAGFIYDSTDSYRAAFMAIAVSYILAAVLFWTMRPAAPSKPAGGHSGLASPVEGASTPS